MEWKSIDSAPADRRILVWNDAWDDTFGEVQTAYKDGDDWVFDSGMDAEFDFDGVDMTPQQWAPIVPPPRSEDV